MGPRPDIADGRADGALQSEVRRRLRVRPAGAAADAAACPSDAKPRALALWLLAPLILLAAGVVVELLVVPSKQWMTRLVGHNSMFCMRMIPLLAAPMLAALIVALRAGAPLHPALTGALPARPRRGSRPSSRLALPR